ncbi:MAG: hypothetical protein GXO95_00150 [Nitrospirae bacterium]|nr:hypothetical protein [Nitrospirota bacterium]
MGRAGDAGGMTEMLDYKYFAGVVLFTLLLIYTYYNGQRINLKKIRGTAASLERALKPVEKRYTWLGGVVGFSADFKVQGFEEVQAVLTLMPRQSLLYMPFVLLRGAEDRLQLLFFLKEKPFEELHTIPVGKRRPHIHNMERLKRAVERHGGLDVEILYERDPSVASGIAGALSYRLSNVKQISLTPERGVFYVELFVKSLTPEELEEFLGRVCDLLSTYKFK